MLYQNLVQSIINNSLEEPFAFPTETVFGLFAPVKNYNLINKIYEIKNRSLDKKLLLMFNSFEKIRNFYEINEYREKIILKNYKKKISFICPLLEGADLHSQLHENGWSGFRITSFKPLVKLFEDTSAVFAQTSLNRSGEQPIMSSDNIPDDIRLKLSYVHEYTLPESLPSTIVKLLDNHFEIIRQGEDVLET